MKLRLPFRRAFEWLPRQRGRLLGGFLLILPATVLDLAIPLLWRKGIDGAVARTMSGTALAGLAALAVLLGAIGCLFKYGMRRQIVGASRAFERDLRHDLFRKLLLLPSDFFGKATVGDLVSRLTQDIEAVRMAIGPGVMYIANALLVAGAAFAMMLSIDVRLTLWMSLPILLLGGVALGMSARLGRSSEAVQAGIAKISAASTESFSGIRVLKVFAREEQQLRRMESFGLDYLAAQMRLARARGGMMALLFLVKDLSQFVILLVGGLHVVAGRASVGDFVLFREWMMQCFWPLVTFGWIVSMVQRGSAGMQRIADVLDTEAAVRSPAVPAPAPPADSAPLGIEWRNVSLRRDGRALLEDVSIVVPPGTSLGVTGRTGSGKSLLVQLVPRLRDPDAGAVLVGGVDLRAWDLERLRRRVGFVPQESFLFSDTLRENVRFARPDAPDAALVAAMEQADLARELGGAFPQGLETRVGERGVTMSGGQRQRATLARALLVDPPVLVLDDCLSAVDAETEARILVALRQALRGRTAVVVSHRVAALRGLDQVAVLDQGRLTELGPPSELLRRGGPLARLEHDQRLIAELEAL